MSTPPLRTVLIAHAEEPLHCDGYARWLAADSSLQGIVRIVDEPSARWSRLRREVRRSGVAGIVDVALMRAWYRVAFQQADAAWGAQALARLQERYPVVAVAPSIDVVTPNSPETRAFLERTRPDVVIALCKHLLKEEIFTIARVGTFVLHPGICPEYRNAHGCFWALARGDYERVGLTLLRVDRGIDTGPIFGYFHCDFDEHRESHIRIQKRMSFDNLDAIWQRIADVAAGRAAPIPVAGRSSRTWGQPRLSAYIGWRLRARREDHALRGA